MVNHYLAVHVTIVHSLDSAVRTAHDNFFMAQLHRHWVLLGRRETRELVR